jgi:hypothetical protein
MNELDPTGKQALPEVVETDPRAAPMVVADLPGQKPFEGPQRKAEELFDETFVILEARRIRSQKGKRGFYYLCQCRDIEDGELFTTLLGGDVVTKTLASWSVTSDHRPLQVTLRDKQGGEFGHYHILE